MKRAVLIIHSHPLQNRVLVIHSSTHIHSERVPHVRTSVRGLIKTGRSPIKGLCFSFSHETRMGHPKTNLALAVLNKLADAACLSSFTNERFAHR
jgi:hypothetical protein